MLLYSFDATSAFRPLIDVVFTHRFTAYGIRPRWYAQYLISSRVSWILTTAALFLCTGVMRAFLVYPTYIVFPNLLPTVQLFDALHRGKKIFLQKKRVKFFWSVFVAIFVWEWFPEYIAPWVNKTSSSLIIQCCRALSAGGACLCVWVILNIVCRTLTGISIFCLAKRDSAWVSRIFGKFLFILS